MVTLRPLIDMDTADDHYSNSESASSDDTEKDSVIVSSSCSSDYGDSSTEYDLNTSSDESALSDELSSRSNSEFEESDLENSHCSNSDNDNSADTTEMGQLSEQSSQALTLLSCFKRHKLSASAATDIIHTMRSIFPNSEEIQRLHYKDILKSVGPCDTRTVHYCPMCTTIFPADPDQFRCSAVGCEGLRYKGPVSSQSAKCRVPRQAFVFADVKKQLQQLLETPGELS